MQVRDDADVLRSLTRDPNMVSWRDHADRLMQVRQEVNTMSEEMCRLQAIRRMAFPWQGRAIDRIWPAVIELADSTQAALKFTHGEDTVNFASPRYTNDLSSMYQVADRIARTTSDYIEIAKSQGDLRQLGRGGEASTRS